MISSENVTNECYNQTLIHDYASRGAIPEYMEILNKHTVNILFNTLAYLCAKNGILGTKRGRRLSEKWCIIGSTGDMKETLDE